MVAVLHPELRIRPMRRSDLDEVHTIEDASYPFPWSRGIFGDCLRIGYCCRVAELDGELAGYSILSVGVGEGHLLNLCVAPAHRRAGLGQALLEGVLVDARLLHAQRLFLEVRPSNMAAIELYQANAFRVIGRRSGYYPSWDGREDALVMVHHLEPGDD